jgi:protein-disulfide isomerase
MLQLRTASRQMFLLLFAIAGVANTAHAQGKTTVNDPNFLKPPAGAKVAVIEFEDLECPMCGQISPVVRAAVARYHVAYLRHDFPLSMHMWAYDAAIDARWFEEHSPALGEEYRARVFANQTAISSKADLLGFTQRFAREKGLAWPFLVDPQGTLKAKVEKDMTLGKTKISLNHTPTVFVVTRTHYVEIMKSDELDGAIRTAMAEK